MSIHPWIYPVAWEVALILPICIFLLCTLLGFIQPPYTGFFCDDYSIHQPFRGDTVGSETLFCVVAVIPLIMIATIEWMIANSTAPEASRGRKFGLKRFGNIYHKYLMGHLAVLLLGEILKTIVGELRPHFIDTCKPNITLLDCHGRFITNYTCTNEYATRLQIVDSRKSFPSGHAAHACFMSAFLSAYLQQRFHWGPWILRPWLQVLLMVWAAFCSVSRIMDSRHHWWDVLAGAILGTAMAVLTVIYVCNSFTTLGSFSGTRRHFPEQHREGITRLSIPAPRTMSPLTEETAFSRTDVLVEEVSTVDETTLNHRLS